MENEKENEEIFESNVNKKFTRTVKEIIALLQMFQVIIKDQRLYSKKDKKEALKRIQECLDYLGISTNDLGFSIIRGDTEAVIMNKYANFDANDIIHHIKEVSSFTEFFNAERKKLLNKLILDDLKRNTNNFENEKRKPENYNNEKKDKRKLTNNEEEEVLKKRNIENHEELQKNSKRKEMPEGFVEGIPMIPENTEIGREIPSRDWQHEEREIPSRDLQSEEREIPSGVELIMEEEENFQQLTKHQIEEIKESKKNGPLAVATKLKEIFNDYEEGRRNEARIKDFIKVMCNYFHIPNVDMKKNNEMSYEFEVDDELKNLLNKEIDEEDEEHDQNYVISYSELFLAVVSSITGRNIIKGVVYIATTNGRTLKGISCVGYPSEKLDQISKSLNFCNDDNEFWQQYKQDENENHYTNHIPVSIHKIVIEMLPVVDDNIMIENTKTTGNFFPYLLKKEFRELSSQLKRYQIYEKVGQIDKENCFVYACIMSKIFVKSEIEKIKTIVQGTDVTLTTIKELTKVILFTCKLINVNNFTGKENVFYVSRGVRHNSTKTIDKSLRMLPIVLDKRSAICYHYYLFENTPFSAYFIKNFLNVKQYAKQKEKEIEYYYDADGWDGDQCIIRTRSTVRKITSKELINYLFEENAFTEIPEADLCKCNFYFAQNKSISDDLTNLPFDSREIKLKDKESEGSKKHSIVYADFECTVQGIHKPFCICFCNENDNDIKFCYGNGCEIQFLKEVKKVNNPIVYFHNLSYDGRMLAKYGIIKAVLKCNKIYAMTILYDGKKIKFRDSLALIPDKLANFCQLFNLGDDGEKEIFPYKYYNEQTMFEGVAAEVGPEENPSWNNDQKNQFIKNLNKLHLIHDGKFNAKEYCLYYCKRDVDILKRGFNAFRKMTEKNLKIDVCSTLTISSLAYKCFLKNAFSNDNIYEFTGATRNYIRKAVIGGRCMTCENKKWKTGITHLDDFDACSLYPSAMRRLYIPQGIPFEWNPSIDLFGRLMKEDQVVATKCNDISNFIVTIEITKIGKKLKFPLIMTKKDGINMFVNELCEMTIDNIYLEDLIKYQQIEFSIKKGVYWVGNKSKKMSEYIKYIYDIRADMKKKKDSNQLIYKLIMNSAYGKTIQKPIDTDVVFKKGKEEFQKYIVKNYNKVLVFEEIGNEIYMIKLMKDVDDFYVPCHIGVLILSMSKRIMNEVICTAEDLNLQIYYQDTDSIHIEHNDLQRLIVEYKNRFGRDLVGTNMGQFHSDFPAVNGKESYSKESIFLGKKAYIDHLFNVDEEDDYCIRMKGVPSNTLIAESNENYEGNLMKMYNEMFNGKEITFNLLKGNAGIELKSNFTVETRKSFERKIKF